MRQYGAIAGNHWESEREFRAAKARAVEKRHGELVAQEQLEGELHPAEIRLIECDAGHCRFCGEGREPTVEIDGVPSPSSLQASLAIAIARFLWKRTR